MNLTLLISIHSKIRYLKVNIKLGIQKNVLRNKLEDIIISII